MSDADKPKYWRRRAEEMRALASHMGKVASNIVMLRIAADYELLAKQAEERRAKAPGNSN
jgi:hypothetical protein